MNEKINKNETINNTVLEMVEKLSLQRNDYIKELKKLNNKIIELEKKIKIYNITIDIIKNTFGD